MRFDAYTPMSDRIPCVIQRRFLNWREPSVDEVLAFQGVNEDAWRRSQDELIARAQLEAQRFLKSRSFDLPEAERIYNKTADRSSSPSDFSTEDLFKALSFAISTVSPKDAFFEETVFRLYYEIMGRSDRERVWGGNEVLVKKTAMKADAALPDNPAEEDDQNERK